MRPSRNFHTLAPKTPARRRLTAGLGHRRHSSPLFLLPTAGPPQTTRPPDGVCAFFLFFFFKTTRQTKHKAAPAAAGPMQIRLNSSRLTSPLPSRRLLRPLPVRPNRPTGVVPPSPPEETKGQRSEVSQIVRVVQEDRAASRDSAFFSRGEAEEGMRRNRGSRGGVKGGEVWLESGEECFLGETKRSSCLSSE